MLAAPDGPARGEAVGVEVPPLPDLGSWPDAVPVLVLGAVVLVGPGLLLCRVAGLRGLLAWACAPPVTVTLLSVGAVVTAPLAPWTLLTAGACLAVALAPVAAVRAWRSRSARRGAAGDDDGSGAPVAGGDVAGGRARGLVVPALVLGAAASAASLVGGITSPALVPQRFDAVFHLNAVRSVLDTGNGSTFELGLLTSTTRGFYPAAWHDLVALVAAAAGLLPTGTGTGASWDLVPVATNATALLVAGLAWPAGVALLARQLAPGRPVAVLAATAVCAAFPVFPALMLNWGVVYPTFLSVAVLPAALAAVLRALAALDPVRPGARPRSAGGPAALVVLGVVPGVALAHPTGAAGLAVLAAPSVAATAWRLAHRGWGSPAGRRAVVAVGAAAALVVGAVVLAATASPLVQSVAGFEWPAAATAPQAVGEALLGAPPQGRGGAAWWGSAAALLGAAVLASRRRHRAVLAGAALAGALYVVGRSTGSSVLTALWYNDPVRIAPLVTVVAAPLAGVGIAALADLLRPVTGGPERARGRRAAAAAVVLLGACATALPGSGVAEAQRSLQEAYSSDSEDAPLLDADELALLVALDDLVPPDGVIADDPHDGGALAYALADRRVLFPHLAGGVPPEAELVGEHLDEAGTDPAVCRAARDLGVTHVLDLGGPSYFSTARTDERYAGLRAASEGSPALEVVATSGRSRLLELTGC